MIVNFVSLRGPNLISSRIINHQICSGISQNYNWDHIFCLLNENNPSIRLKIIIQFCTQTQLILMYWSIKRITWRKLVCIWNKKFPFINFEHPLYFRLRKGGLGGSTSRKLSDLKFMFLETLGFIGWDQGDC